MVRRVGSRITRWLLASTLLGLGIVAIGSAAANAGPYPPTQCATVSVSTTTPDSGETMTVSGTGFAAGEQVTLELHSTPREVGTATVQADGSFTTQITIPKDMSGRHLLSVSGGQPSCPVGEVALDIQASAALGEQLGPNGGGGGLSSTGVQIALLLALAALALAAGVALTRAAREKRSRT